MSKKDITKRAGVAQGIGPQFKPQLLSPNPPPNFLHMLKYLMSVIQFLNLKD
jgi:hypothetical protein